MSNNPSDVSGERGVPLLDDAQRIEAGLRETPLNNDLSSAIYEHVVTYLRGFSGIGTRIELDPEDLANATMIKLIEGLEAFEFKSTKSFRTYIRVVARNAFYSECDRVRRQKRGGKSRPLSLNRSSSNLLKDLVELDGTPCDIVLSRERAMLVRDQVNMLSIHARIIVDLYFYEGLEVSNIAIELGATTDAIKNSLFESRKILRERIRREPAFSSLFRSPNSRNGT